jgi:lipopolysaccharide export LptBFGC system permease protein LptF
MTRHSLRLGGYLDRYVTRMFAASYLTAFMLVVGLYLVVDMATNLDEYLQPDEETGEGKVPQVLRYYLLHCPFLYLQVSPFVTLVGGLFAAARLVRRNELAAALNAGVSSRRVLLPVFTAAVLLAVGMIALREWATERLGTERQALFEQLKEGRSEPVYEDFWVRTASGHSVRVGEYRPFGGEAGRGPEIRDLSCRFSVGDVSVALIAERAWPVPGGAGHWQLEGGLRHTVGTEERQDERITLLDDLSFTPTDIELDWKGREFPQELSFTQTKALLARDPDNAKYGTLLHYHLSYPIAGVVLLAVGVPLVLGRERRRQGDRVAGGVLLCGAYFGLDFACRSMGLQGQIGGLTAAWFPIVAFGSLGIALFSSMRS